MMFIQLRDSSSTIINTNLVVSITHTNGAYPGNKPYAIITMTGGHPVPISKEEADRLSSLIMNEDTAHCGLIASYIVRIERNETIISNRPVWRCVTHTGLRVDIIQHDNPDLNNYGLFESAGWADELNAIELYQTVDMELSIPVVLRKRNNVYEVLLVHSRSDDALIQMESF